MSLPWFAFDADAYTGDTPHLTVEEHGAYLLLMLAYYRMEKALPASDRALASICKMSAEQWATCKPTLAPFFIEIEGKWLHERCDREIEKRKEEVAKYHSRAQAGAAARWGNRPAPVKHAPPVQQASVTNADIDIDRISLSVDLAVEKAESGDKPPEQEAIPQSNPLGAAYRELVDNGVVKPDMTAVPGDFEPNEAIKAQCLGESDPSTYALEVQKFIFAQRDKGALSCDWDASFQLWWSRFISFRAARPARGKPRVEVNTTSSPEADSINWDWHLKRWKTNQSTWSRRTCGPEPGQPGCRAPTEMLEKYGIADVVSAKEPTK